MPTKKKAPAVKKSLKTKKKKSAAVQSSRTPAVAKLQKNIAQKKRSKISTMNVAMHFIIAGSAIAVLLLLGVVESGTFGAGTSKAADKVPVTISLEHVGPLTLSALFAKKENVGYLSLTNRSNQTIHVSLPSSWHRTEVSGASIAEFVSDIPVFGFTRWTVPPFAGIKMLLPEAPNAVLFESTSSSTAAVEISMVDLDTLSESNRVILVQKQALAPLAWGSKE